MSKFIMSTEDVIKKNGYLVKIVTSGIDLSEFNNNPIMLSEHSELVLGTWKDVSTVDNKLVGTPVFDDDAESQRIKNKIEKGTIKSASIGIDILEAYMDGDVLVISKSLLLECSIVGIPANSKAKKIENSGNTVMLFSKNNKLDIKNYINTLNDMSKKETKVEEKDTKVELSNEVTVVEEVVEEVIETKEETPVVEEVKEVKAEEVVVEDNKIEDLTAVKIELSAKVTDLTSQVASISTEKDSLKLELSNKDKTILNLSKEIEGYKAEKMDNLLEVAIKDGKITREAKVDFLELSYDKAESLIGKLTGQTKSLLTELKASNEAHKSYDWYLKNDKEGLRKLSKDNPSLYKQIEKEYSK